MSDADDLLDRRHGAQHVRHVGDGDHLGARRQRGLEGLDVEGAVIVDIHPAQHRALALAPEMPRHDVGVVLHDRQHDLVALHDPVPQRGRDEIDRLGGRAREDDLVRRGRIEKAAHGLARAFERLRRGIGEVVQAAVDVRILGLVGTRDALDHRPRLLDRGGIVEIDQRLAVGFDLEDREVRPDPLDVEGGFGHRWRLASHCSTLPVSSTRIRSSATASIASAAKAFSSSDWASLSGMPRARR